MITAHLNAENEGLIGNPPPPLSKFVKGSKGSLTQNSVSGVLESTARAWSAEPPVTTEEDGKPNVLSLPDLEMIINDSVFDISDSLKTLNGSETIVNITEVKNVSTSNITETENNKPKEDFLLYGLIQSFIGVLLVSLVALLCLAIAVYCLKLINNLKNL
jgi:hypothetical protein